MAYTQTPMLCEENIFHLVHFTQLAKNYSYNVNDYSLKAKNKRKVVVTPSWITETQEGKGECYRMLYEHMCKNMTIFTTILQKCKIGV